MGLLDLPLMTTEISDRLRNKIDIVIKKAKCQIAFTTKNSPDFISSMVVVNARS